MLEKEKDLRTHFNTGKSEPKQGMQNRRENEKLEREREKHVVVLTTTKE